MFVWLLLFSVVLGCSRHVTSILTRGDVGTEGDGQTCPSQEASAAEMSPRAQQATPEASLWEFFYFFPLPKKFSGLSQLTPWKFNSTADQNQFRDSISQHRPLSKQADT